jgi:hypothetical protein
MEWEELEQYSVAELEAMAIEFEAKIRKRSWKKSWEDDRHLKRILSVRREKLNAEFVFTPENIAKILRLNQQLMDGMEKLRKEGEKIVRNLEERVKNNDPFLHDYEINATISPLIKEPDEDGDMSEPDEGIYCLLNSVFSNEGICLNFDPRLDSNDRYFDKTINCNRIMAKNGELDDYFISRALCNFHDYTEWSWQDIIKINELWCEIYVRHQHFVEKI